MWGFDLELFESIEGTNETWVRPYYLRRFQAIELTATTSSNHKSPYDGLHVLSSAPLPLVVMG